jgi:hypothetical protein
MSAIAGQPGLPRPTRGVDRSLRRRAQPDDNVTKGDGCRYTATVLQSHASAATPVVRRWRHTGRFLTNRPADGKEMMTEFLLVRLQIALFLSTLDLTSKLDLAAAIRDASGRILDADPLILPVPGDAPHEVPRVIQASRDEQWICQVAGNRLDIVFQTPSKTEGNTNFQGIARQQAQVSSAIWEVLQSRFKASGHRIGMVSTFRATVEEAARTLRRRFLIPSNAPEPHELQLHVLHTLTLRDLLVNRWTRCSAGPLPSPGPGPGVFQLDIDINTLADRPLDLTPSRIVGFIENGILLVLSTRDSLFSESEYVERVF